MTEKEVGKNAAHETEGFSRRSLLQTTGAGLAAAGLPTSAAGMQTTANSESGERPPEKFANNTTADTVAESSGNWSEKGIWSNGKPGNSRR